MTLLLLLRIHQPWQDVLAQLGVSKFPTPVPAGNGKHPKDTTDPSESTSGDRTLPRDAGERLLCALQYSVLGATWPRRARIVGRSSM
jgi:hypothetical protein